MTSIFQALRPESFSSVRMKWRHIGALTELLLYVNMWLNINDSTRACETETAKWKLGLQTWRSELVPSSVTRLLRRRAKSQLNQYFCRSSIVASGCFCVAVWVSPSNPATPPGLTSFIGPDIFPFQRKYFHTHLLVPQVALYHLVPDPSSQTLDCSSRSGYTNTNTDVRPEIPSSPNQTDRADPSTRKRCWDGPQDFGRELECTATVVWKSGVDDARRSLMRNVVDVSSRVYEEMIFKPVTNCSSFIYFIMRANKRFISRMRQNFKTFSSFNTSYFIICLSQIRKKQHNHLSMCIYCMLLLFYTHLFNQPISRHDFESWKN